MTISTPSRGNAHNRQQPTRATQNIALVGDALLAKDLQQAWIGLGTIHLQHWQTLEQFAEAYQPETAQVALVIALSACCNPAFDRHIQHWCREKHLAFLRLSIWQHEAVIGPFVLPDQPGCVACAEMRRVRALLTEARNELHFLAWCASQTTLQERPPNPWFTQHTRQVLGLLATYDITAFLQTGTPAMGWQTVRFLRLRELTNTCHTFLPDPLCEICAQVPDDCAQDAIFQMQPRLRRSTEHYRVRSAVEEIDTLEAHYVDQRMGLRIIPPLGLRTNAATFATTAVHTFEYPFIQQQITGTGTSYTFRASRATAILETLERYCGFLPRAKRSNVYGSYAQLQSQAINPETLGLFSEQLATSSQTRPRSQRLVPYSADLPFHWVWACSLGKQQPVLVPEQVAYYGVQTVRPEQEHFLFETSNGCAVGGSLEDAIFHGLCEVIERDAFFLTWYARLPVPVIDWHSTNDSHLLLAIERSERMNGFEFHALDCTTDMGLPTILMLAVNKEHRAPKVILGAGAHVNPDKALATAFFETASTIVGQKQRFPRENEKGLRLLQDSSLIKSIEDHVLVGAMPEAFQRFDFLLNERPAHTMQERFAAHYARQPSLDLTKELLRLVEQVKKNGHEVIVVDQTAPELRANNFFCVRVLVPGLIPLTFGHQFRRTRHLTRLYHFPQKSGYTDRVLSESDLNQDPHAFP
jgi:ribosomal protein S12 methylthiotransferase accessory factor